MELFPGHLRVQPAEPSPEVQGLAAWLPRGLRLGTSSWSFPGWAGQVWAREAPREELSARGLAAYAAHPLLRTVSVDRSYYAPVQVETWRSYAQQVPDDFRFVVKAASQLTASTRDRQPNPRFLDPGFALGSVVAPMVAGLEGKLGGLLVQIPPGPVPDDGLARLERLLEALAGEVPTVAVEPRGRGWLGPRYADVLAAWGAVHVLSVHPAMPDLREQWVRGGVARGGSLWVRWNLGSGMDYERAKQRFAPFRELAAPDLVVRDKLARAVHWALSRERQAVVIANNKAEGCAPATLAALARALRAMA